MTLDVETFQRAAELYDHRSLCDHEAGHAAAALILGLDVREACAPFRTVEDVEQADSHETAGYVLLDRTEDDPALAHAHAVTVLAGPLADGKANWPPRWPLSLAPQTPDEAQVGELVKLLDLDEQGYNALTRDALELTATREYERLALAIGHALEQHERLDAIALARIKAIAEGAAVEHLTLKAVTTVSTDDRGEFTAIAAAYSVDRVKDQIIPGAFAATIERWRRSGKRMPLHWNHQGEAANVIGWIDPASMRETAEGLEVSGKLDLTDSDTAREAWRSMKNNAMSLSFGYITTRQRKRDEVNELHEIDLFEISIVPAPANADTRILAMKSIGDGDDLAAFRTEWRDQLASVLGHSVSDTLRTKAKRIEREHGPVTVARFEC